MKKTVSKSQYIYTPVFKKRYNLNAFSFPLKKVLPISFNLHILVGKGRLFIGCFISPITANCPITLSDYNSAK